MKNRFIMISLTILVLVLSACGPSTGIPADSATTPAADQPSQSEVNATPAAVDTAGERQLSQAMLLALGTFKLEETNTPIDEAQAQALLPLWKAVRSLSGSETAASQEVQAVLNQIEKTITPEQLQAIQEMNLTFEDMGAIAEAMGLDFGGRFGGDISPEMQATREAAVQSGEQPPAGGGFGAGMGPGGGMGMGGGSGGETGISPEARQTAIAERGGRSGLNMGLSPALLEAVINFLQEKAGV